MAEFWLQRCKKTKTNWRHRERKRCFELAKKEAGVDDDIKIRDISLQNDLESLLNLGF